MRTTDLDDELLLLFIARSYKDYTYFDPKTTQNVDVTVSAARRGYIIVMTTWESCVVTLDNIKGVDG